MKKIIFETLTKVGPDPFKFYHLFLKGFFKDFPKVPKYNIIFRDIFLFLFLKLNIIWEV